MLLLHHNSFLDKWTSPLHLRIKELLETCFATRSILNKFSRHISQRVIMRGREQFQWAGRLDPLSDLAVFPMLMSPGSVFTIITKLKTMQ